jgi:AraC-like DNA-binding protein
MNVLASSLKVQIQLLGAQSFKMNSTRPSRFLSHRIWGLELITKGQLQVDVGNGNWMTLPENSSILYAPGTHYREKVDSHGTVCHSIVLFFEVGTLPKAVPWNRFLEPYFTICDDEKLVLPLAEASLRHLGLSDSDDVQATAAFLSIVVLLLRAEIQEKRLIVASERQGGDMVARANQYMRKRLSESVQLAEIAAHMGMSVSGFAHNYKRQTGLSPMTMLRRMRVEAAKSYLLRERFTLSQIASETGFADAFHLSRTFKEITGVSPRKFRSK